MTVIVANLDAEEHWRHQLDPGLPRGPLRTRVLAQLASVGSLMRVLARPGDRLWTLLPIDAQRLVPYAGIATPEVISGPPPRDLRHDEMLPWATALPWCEASASRLSARVNHRRLGLELRHRLSGDDGSRMIGDADQLGAVVQEREQRWVMKAPLSAAGRDRFLSPAGPTTRDAAVETVHEAPAVRRLFRRHGELAFERWVERTVDYGVLITVGDTLGDSEPEPQIHRQRVDPHGRFVAIELGGPWSDHELAIDAQLRDHALAVAETLGALGYRGPLSVDAWSFVDAGGAAHLQPIGEINARWSVGRLARAWAEALGLTPGPRVLARLCFGNAVQLKAMPADVRRRLPLLLPDELGHHAIWIDEISVDR